VVGNRGLREVFNAPESTAPAYRAEGLDEYRELALLANAWERQARKQGPGEGPSGRAEDAEGEEPAVR